MSSNTDPCAAFFDYAALCWKYRLDSAPFDFSLDDVLELASPASARYSMLTRLGSVPLIADERCSAFSGHGLTGPPMSSNTDPCGAFFDYAVLCWKYPLDSAPFDFSLDDVLELASPASARYSMLTRLGSVPLVAAGSSEFAPILELLVYYGNSSIYEQLLDRLVPNADGDRRLIVGTATRAIMENKLDHFRTLMNHQSTAKAMKTAEMLQMFIRCWTRRDRFSDNLKEWTKLITGLFDMLVASDTIPSPNDLLPTACQSGCMPIIEKLCERAKADRAFKKQLMRPTYGIGPLCTPIGDDIATLGYLCQQEIEAHTSNRYTHRMITPAYLDYKPQKKIFEQLLEKFPWLTGW